MSWRKDDITSNSNTLTRAPTTLSDEVHQSVMNGQLASVPQPIRARGTSHVKEKLEALGVKCLDRIDGRMCGLGEYDKHTVCQGTYHNS